MSGSRQSAVVRCLYISLICSCAHQLFAYASAAALERPPALRQQANSRIAVMFDQQHKARIKQQLLDQGYRIYTEGPSFFAVGSPVLPANAVPAVTATDATRTSLGRRLLDLLCTTCSRNRRQRAKAAAAALRPAGSIAADSRWSSSSRSFCWAHWQQHL